jgi:hypothetical protein
MFERGLYDALNAPSQRGHDGRSGGTNLREFNACSILADRWQCTFASTCVMRVI